MGPSFYSYRGCKGTVSEGGFPKHFYQLGTEVQAGTAVNYQGIERILDEIFPSIKGGFHSSNKEVLGVRGVEIAIFRQLSSSMIEV